MLTRGRAKFLEVNIEPIFPMTANTGVKRGPKKGFKSPAPDTQSPTRSSPRSASRASPVSSPTPAEGNADILFYLKKLDESIKHSAEETRLVHLEMKESFEEARLICSEVEGLRAQMQEELQRVREEMLGIKEDMRSVVQEELNNMRADVEGLRGEVKGIGAELESRFAQLTNRVGQIEHSQKVIQTRVDGLPEVGGADQNSYDFRDAVSQAVNEHKRQELLSADVRIVGLPEDLLAGDIKAAAEKFMEDHLQLPPGKLISAERVTVKKLGAPSLVVAKCVSKKARIEVVAAGTKFKPSGVFFRSALTPLQLRMLPRELDKVKEARQAGKYAVIRDGRAFIHEWNEASRANRTWLGDRQRS